MLSDVALEFEYLCLIGFIAKSTNRGSVHSSAGIGDHKKGGENTSITGSVLQYSLGLGRQIASLLAYKCVEGGANKSEGRSTLTFAYCRGTELSLGLSGSSLLSQFHLQRVPRCLSCRLPFGQH